MTRSARRARAAGGSEWGQATMFGLGLVLIMLLVAGLSLDLWRLVSARRSLAGDADATAAAAANAIDADHYRRTGELVVDPALAATVAAERLATVSEGVVVTGLVVDPALVEVRLSLEVELVLLDVGRSSEPITVEVVGRAVPRRGA